MVGDRVRIDSIQSPYNRNLGKVTRIVSANTTHPGKTIQVALDVGEGQSLINWYSPMNLELIEKCKVDTTKEANMSYEADKFTFFDPSKRFCLVDAKRGEMVSFEDGHYTMTKDITRIVQNGMFGTREAAEKSLDAIKKECPYLQVYEITKMSMFGAPVPRYTKDEIIAKVRQKGVTDDELHILMGREE